jgi:hypothetical protein
LDIQFNLACGHPTSKVIQSNEVQKENIQRRAAYGLGVVSLSLPVVADPEAPSSFPIDRVAATNSANPTVPGDAASASLNKAAI